MSPVTVREAINSVVARLAVGERGRTEAEIQHDVAQFLELGDFNLEETDVRLQPSTDTGGRIDVELGRTVIEIKRRLDTAAIRDAAETQIKGYLDARQNQTGERHAGILTDGRWWGLYRSGEIQGLRLVAEYINRGDVDEIVVWLEGALATKRNISPTPDEIESRLGVSSSSFKLDIDTLREIHSQYQNEPALDVKQMLWRRLLVDALGLGFADLSEDEQSDLFVRHTYLVLVAEVIAHLVIDVDVTTTEPSHLTTGALFRQARISGVVEADFFDWVASYPEGIEFVRVLARRLARFDFSEPRHDVLKILYESVIDPGTRHDLGEYYTPDWLASQMVESVVDDPLHQTVLDPACGSGTFLFWAIRRVLDAEEAAGSTLQESILSAVNRVFGIDLHPVAVALARVTVLLAIGRNRLRQRPDFGVQVFLGDSMMWRQPDDIFTQDEIVVRTEGDDGQLPGFADPLSFPAGLVDDLQRFDRLINDLTHAATNREPREPRRSIAGLLSQLPHQDRPSVERAYSILCDLHDNLRDHIWGYYIRNLARPFAVARHKVDRLVGNPPWLAYRHMDRSLQQEFRRQTEARGIWAGQRLATHQDLAGYFVARSTERFLTVEGKFGFVMPAGALKGLHYAGFRTGEWTAQDREVVKADLGEETPWRLTEIKPHPFPIPSSVVFGTRTENESTPLPTTVDNWRGELPAHGNLEWSDVEPRITRAARRVMVATGEGSPYRSEFFQGATFTPRRLVTVLDATDATSAIGPGPGRRTIRSRVSSQDERPWRDLDPLLGVVEERFLVPLYKGESVVPFRVLDPVVAVVPHNGEELMDVGHQELDLYPGLAEWWNEADRLWRANRSERSPDGLLDRVDYHSALTRQYPVQSRRVVYTTSGTNLAAAVVEDPNGVIDTSLYWSTAHSSAEAYYLVAILNSQTLLDLVAEYQSEGAFGPRHFHKHVFEIPFARFNGSQEIHRRLSAAGRDATQTADAVAIADLTPRMARRAVREELGHRGVTATINDLVSELLNESVST